MIDYDIILFDMSNKKCNICFQIVKPGDRRRRRFFKLTIAVAFCEGLLL